MIGLSGLTRGKPTPRGDVVDDTGVELRLEREPLEGHGERGVEQVLQLQLVNAGVDQGQGEGLLQGDDVGVGVSRQPGEAATLNLGRLGMSTLDSSAACSGVRVRRRATRDDPV